MVIDECYLPHDSNDAPTHRGSSFNIKDLMKSFLVLSLLSDDTQDHVEYAVKEYDHKNQHIAVILGLIDCHKEAVPFHYERYY